MSTRFTLGYLLDRRKSSTKYSKRCNIHHFKKWKLQQNSVTLSKRFVLSSSYLSNQILQKLYLETHQKICIFWKVEHIKWHLSKFSQQSPHTIKSNLSVHLFDPTHSRTVSKGNKNLVFLFMYVGSQKMF